MDDNFFDNNDKFFDNALEQQGKMLKKAIPIMILSAVLTLSVFLLGALGIALIVKELFFS